MASPAQRRAQRINWDKARFISATHVTNEVLDDLARGMLQDSEAFNILLNIQREQRVILETWDKVFWPNKKPETSKI